MQGRDRFRAGAPVKPEMQCCLSRSTLISALISARPKIFYPAFFIAQHLDARMDNQLNAKLFAVQLIGQTVNQEGHIIANHLKNEGVCVPAMLACFRGMNRNGRVSVHALHNHGPERACRMKKLFLGNAAQILRRNRTDKKLQIGNGKRRLSFRNRLTQTQGKIINQ